MSQIFVSWSITILPDGGSREMIEPQGSDKRCSVTCPNLITHGHKPYILATDQRKSEPRTSKIQTTVSWCRPKDTCTRIFDILTQPRFKNYCYVHRAYTVKSDIEKSHKEIVKSDVRVNKIQLGATPLPNMNKCCNGKLRLNQSQTQKVMYKCTPFAHLSA